MAQTGYTPISIYYSSTAGNTPTAGNLVAGELAINTADGKLFYKDSAGVVQVIAGKGGAGVAGGSNTQVQYNSSGSLAGSANFVFDGTSVGVGTSSPTQKLDIVGTTSTTRVRVSSSTAIADFHAQNTGGSFYFGIDSSVGSATGTAYANYLFGTAAYPMLFYTNGTERMRITSTGDVGIGTNAPSQFLHIAKNQNAGTQVLVDNQNTGTGAFSNYLLNNSTSSGGGGLILFGTNWPASGMYRSGGMYLYTQASNTGGITINSESNTPIYFGTNNTERMRIDAAGNVGIGTNSPSSYGKLSVVTSSASSTVFAIRDDGTPTSNLLLVSSNSAGTIARINTYGIGLGGATPSSGMGITFPAAQSASSDANTLDDYEEGTWTPALSFGGASVGLTYSNRAGVYTKVGNIVTVQFYILLSAKGSSTGDATVGGLPFAAYNAGGIPTVAGVLVNEAGGTSFPSGTYILPWPDSNLYLRYNNGSAFGTVGSGNFGNSTAIYGSVTYRVN